MTAGQVAPGFEAVDEIFSELHERSGKPGGASLAVLDLSARMSTVWVGSRPK